MLALIVLIFIVSKWAIATTNPLKIVGNKFFDLESGEQFFMKGIAYQSQRTGNIPYDRNIETPYIDNLADPVVCERDLAYFKELGVNIIRVYQIDPKKNHDYCMKALADAGIYVLLDLPEPDLSINRNDPYWDTEIFARYKDVIDAMHKYDNVAGFLAGNEVANSRFTASLAPFVKAAIRDSKQYMKQKDYRAVPVGYASNDDALIRNHVANYFVCSDEGTADFFGTNMYEWCGYSTYQTSGYRDRTAELQNFPVPVFFSEFGCNSVSPRPFTEIEALLSLPMTKVFSGGIVYEYFNYENNYGVVKETGTNELIKLTDYEFLKKRYNSIQPPGIRIDMKSHNESKEISIPCLQPTEFWNVSSVLPPLPDYNKCECLQASFSCILSPYTTSNEQELIAEICSQVDCHDIKVDGSTGVYGKYADCSMKQRASYALNSYYCKHDKAAESCDFNGRAILITNSDKNDLQSIYSLNGHSCQEILGDNAPSSEERQVVSNDRIDVGGNKLSQVSNISHKWNETTRMQSHGTRRSKIFGYPMLLLIQVVNYIHI